MNGITVDVTMTWTAGPVRCSSVGFNWSLRDHACQSLHQESLASLIPQQDRRVVLICNTNSPDTWERSVSLSLWLRFGFSGLRPSIFLARVYHHDVLSHTMICIVYDILYARVMSCLRPRLSPFLPQILTMSQFTHTTPWFQNFEAGKCLSRDMTVTPYER